MKLFKSLFTLAMVLVLSTTIATAQRTERKGEARKKLTTEERAQKLTDKLVKKLSLDKNQTKQVLAINVKYLNQTKTLKKNPNRDKQKAAYKTLRENQNKEIEVLLTPEQLVLYTQKKEQKIARKAEKRKKKKEARKRGNTPEEKAERRTKFLTSKLSLTEEQVPKVKAINLDYFTKIAKMNAMLKTRKANKVDKKPLKEERKSALKTVLTDKQFALMTAKPRRK